MTNIDGNNLRLITQSDNVKNAYKNGTTINNCIRGIYKTKLNNNILNLEWITQKENTIHGRGKKIFYTEEFLSQI